MATSLHHTSLHRTLQSRIELSPNAQSQSQNRSRSKDLNHGFRAEQPFDFYSGFTTPTHENLLIHPTGCYASTSNVSEREGLENAAEPDRHARPGWKAHGIYVY